MVQRLQPIDQLNISEKPPLQLRLSGHCDNLDGTIERGYDRPVVVEVEQFAGQS